MFSITGLIIACLIYHNAHGLPDTQIIGGSDAPDGKYPYMVSLKNTYSGTHFCGGAIIGKNYIITAAHCVNNKESNNIVIAVGSVYLSNFYTPYAVEKIILHPDYNKTQYNNDIALLKVKGEIALKDNVNKIDLTKEDKENFAGTEFIVTGWGRTSHSPVSNRLQEIKVTGFSQETCNKTYTNITNNHICTLQAWGKGVCNGDSGSALNLDGKLAGIVSFGSIPCATGYPDVFTKVYHYTAWINEYNAASNQQLNIFLGLFMMYLCIHSFL